MRDDTLPVVVIGAGPQGLSAAAHAVERGLPVLVLEAGSTPGYAGAPGCSTRQVPRRVAPAAPRPRNSSRSPRRLPSAHDPKRGTP